ncbi:DNA polymerase I [soil metagenome]
MSEQLYLIDAMAMIYRAYFALISSPLINSKGKNTSAVFGFVNSMIKILEDEKPHHLAVCFDTAKPTFRHEEFPAYKAQRQEMPTDMPWQIDMVKEVLKAFNIPMIELDGYEADDIIGTLTHQAEKEGCSSFMVTPDKDYMQLVTEKVIMYKPQRNLYGNKMSEVEKIGIDGVIAKFGVPPAKVIEILGLMGDTADNIPGVKGVGEKTAASLIQQFGSIEGIYENIEQITKPKLKETLIREKDNALLSKKLATIICNVPLHINFHDLKIQECDKPKLNALFKELEFKTLTRKYAAEGEEVTAADMQNDLPKSFEPTSATTYPANILVDMPERKKEIKTIRDRVHEYTTIMTEKEFDAMIKTLSKTDLISFDTETNSKDCMDCDMVGMSFSIKSNEAYYVPVHGTIKENVSEDSLFKNKEKSKPAGIEINYAISKLKPLLESNKIRKIGQNIKYDYVVMKNYGLIMKNIFFDTLVGSFIISPEGYHDMDYLSEKYLSYKPIPISALIGTGKDQITMDKVEISKAAEYAGEDADITLELYQYIKFELEKLDQYKLCKEIEFPLVRVLGEMEFEGIKIDEKILHKLTVETDKLIKELEIKICEHAGETFNINSTKQLAVILFEKLQLDTLRKTKTGYSTDVKVLEGLKDKHEIIPLLLEYRTLTKIKSTYLEGLAKAVNKKSKRVHTSFNQCIAATGRLSSVNPNLQNIPIRTEAGRSIRKAFVPKDKSFKILSADYSQIELRIMAHYADDENMIKAFKDKHDIHTETAMRVFNLAEKKDMTPNHRRKAKEVNFGIIYGIGAFGLASRLEIKNSEAKNIIERYFTEYPKVRNYMEETKAFARKNGYVETLKGRRRYLKQINNQNATARAEDERAAINMPIQGTAADMIKIAMINIQEEIDKKKLKSRMLLQVHDELVFEASIDEMEVLKKIVADKMKNAIKLKVPVEVEMGVGDNWYEAH